MGRADQVDQLLDAVIGVAETELGRRNAEFRALGGDAHVASERGAHPTADAVAADHRNRRLQGFLQAQPRAFGNLRIGGSRFFGGAPLLEFGNVGAGNKGAPAGAADDDDPDRVVALEIVDDARHRLPHFERDRVVPRRIVENQTTDARLLLGDHLAGHRLVEHGFLSLISSLPLSLRAQRSNLVEIAASPSAPRNDTRITRLRGRADRRSRASL